MLDDIHLCLDEERLSSYICKKLTPYCPRKFKTELRRMVRDIFHAYNDLPYHNMYHGSEVMLMCIGLCAMFKIPKELTFLTCVCALCHDIGHTGTRSIQHGTQSIQHQDMSTKANLDFSLQNFEDAHVFVKESVMELRHINLLRDLSNKYGIYKYVRYSESFVNRLFNNIIMITDINNSKQFQSIFRTHFTLDPTRYPIATCALLVICADVGHFAKPFLHHMYWSHRCLEENLLLGVTLNEMSKMNIGFMDNYVIPLFQLLKDRKKIVKPNTEKHCCVMQQIYANRGVWDKYGSCTIDKMLEPSNSQTSSTKHMKDVCICMIDIVNFSRWCSYQSPNDIFDKMTEYNTFLSKHIANRTDVEKIELVGDSVLIIGGFDSKQETERNVLQILLLVRDIIFDLDEFHKIFSVGSESINSLRIGIHVGDIYCGFIRNPCKYQVFGNAINVASRLEGTAVPGAFSISSTAMSHIDTTSSEWNDFSSSVIIGKRLVASLKGVGKIQYHNGFLASNSVLIADDDTITLQIMKVSIGMYSNLECVLENNIEDVFARLRERTYRGVLLDVHFGTSTIFDTLRKFRVWESVCREHTQRVYLISAFNNNDWYNETDIVDGLYQGFIEKTHIGDKKIWMYLFS